MITSVPLFPSHGAAEEDRGEDDGQRQADDPRVEPQALSEQQDAGQRGGQEPEVHKVARPVFAEAEGNAALEKRRSPAGRFGNAEQPVAGHSPENIERESVGSLRRNPPVQRGVSEQTGRQCVYTACTRLEELRIDGGMGIQVRVHGVSEQIPVAPVQSSVHRKRHHERHRPRRRQPQPGPPASRADDRAEEKSGRQRRAYPIGRSLRQQREAEGEAAADESHRRRPREVPQNEDGEGQQPERDGEVPLRA